MFHYVAVFETMLAEYPTDDWFKKAGETEEFGKPHLRYNPIMAKADRAQLEMFTALLWKNLQDLFGESVLQPFFEMAGNREELYPDTNYSSALAYCQCVTFEDMSKANKKNFLLASLFEVLDLESAIKGEKGLKEYSRDHSNRVYRLNKLNDSITVFPKKTRFLDQLWVYSNDKNVIYRDDFNEFLEATYGKAVEDEDMHW